MKKQVEVVAAIIFNDDKKIFLAQRSYGDLKDTWEFPGGKVEQGETNEEALVREIKEELNSTIKVEKFFDTVTYEYPTFIIKLNCYICKLIEGRLTIDEAIHEGCKFVEINNLLKEDLAPADYIIANKIKDTYKETTL